MDPSKIAQLKAFVQLCESNPAVLQDPSLRFFRNYLEKLDAKLPSSAYGKSEKPKVEESDDDMPELEEQFKKNQASSSEASDFEGESEVELDNEGGGVPDNDPPQQMGDANIEVTDEMRDNAQVAKSKAMEALAEDDLEAATGFLTEAILCNPSSAILYANRAGVYVKMKKPNAAIRDADAAIQINPDSAKGYKWRGEANALLGRWEEAAKDLHLASRLDYDEEISAVLKKVEPNVHKIDEHRKKYQRLHKEREERRAARERAKHTSQKKKAERTEGGSGTMPGAMPGMPGGVDMGKLFSDPELLAAFQDPEVMAALNDAMLDKARMCPRETQ